MKRLSRISVTNLFDTFDHTIAMNLGEHITIIHGPNGFGKTALLRMLDGLFNAHYSVLRNIPYAEFRVDFDDHTSIAVSRTIEEARRDKKRNARVKLSFTFSAHGDEGEQYSPQSRESDIELRIPLHMLDEVIPNLTRIGAESWRYLPTNEVLSFEDILERFEPQLERFIGYRESRESRQPKNQVPPWLQELAGSVHFVQAQRLFSPSFGRRDRDRPYRPDDGSSTMESAVTMYSDELGKAIRSKLADSAVLFQQIDRTFPRRVVRESMNVGLTTEQLQTKLSELEAERSNLMAAGLLGKEEDLDFQVPQQIDETMTGVLAVYARDVEQKLGFFGEMARKIDVFKAIINRRFLFKEMSIDQNKGFQFRTRDGKLLSPSDLSSGEQNELVLFYELLFRVTPGSLILLDEPEISLHIAWQEQFLKDLRDIIQLSNLDVLIATHSPQIIYDRWDLTVELAGPPQ